MLANSDNRREPLMSIPHAMERGATGAGGQSNGFGIPRLNVAEVSSCLRAAHAQHNVAYPIRANQSLIFLTRGNEPNTCSRMSKGHRPAF